MLIFHVTATPVAQPRPRIVTVHGRAMAVSNPKRHPITAFKAKVRETIQAHYRQKPRTGPVRLSLFFGMPRPGRLCWKRRPMTRCPHVGRPDLDNLVKGVKDALRGVLFVDDSQVCRLEAGKFHVGGDEKPFVSVWLETLEERQDDGSPQADRPSGQ